MKLLKKSLMAMSVLGSVIILGGCIGGSGSGSDSQGIVNGVTFTINSPGQIAQESDADYNNNVNGLITGTTLKKWISNWSTNRPAGITGKLVIFQVATGPAGAEYIKGDGVNVFTYLSPSAEWIQTRINGVIETPSMVPDGATMDALFKKYNIDPSKDMIIAAMGTGSTGNAMAQGRIWYALRYWGVAKEHLAILNGGNQWLKGNEMVTGDFQATAAVAPTIGTFSVRSLTDDNTQLQATVEDLLKVLSSSDTDSKTDGIFIWDARSLSQYSAGERVEFGEDTDSNTAGSQACTTGYCAPIDPSNYMWTFQNAGSRQGHPFGTMQLQYTHLLDSTKGYSYRTKSVLASYLAGNTDARGIGFVNGQYATVGSSNAYQSGDTIYTYCETTFRAMITGVTSAVILGKPTRFYDGAMVEWNSLSNIIDKTGAAILPANSPWRTDIKSFFRPATSSALVNTRTVTDSFAASAHAIVNSDKAYKSGVIIPTAGSGGALPGNPCGG